MRIGRQVHAARLGERDWSTGETTGERERSATAVGSDASGEIERGIAAQHQRGIETGSNRRAAVGQGRVQARRIECDDRPAIGCQYDAGKEEFGLVARGSAQDEHGGARARVGCARGGYRQRQPVGLLEARGRLCLRRNLGS
ncbi:MAG: hypothetical protein M5U08_09920 [Burkholderiales bacterium]|nr:hypothetical protein [Burkholderiales bacterium]